LILTSDKTLLANSGKFSAWPLYLTIGNIPNNIRFVPKQHCAQLVALIPIPKGLVLERISLISGIETHQVSDEFRLWKRTMYHRVIGHVLKNLEQHMNDGLEMRCADGLDRLCFPVLCHYIGDMEEQWHVTCQVRPACPKCHRRGTRVDGEELEIDWREHQDDDLTTHDQPRTDADARSCRIRFRENPEYPLHELGYHPDEPFSASYKYGGILDAVGPDLLHQVSKCFKDYGVDQWFWRLIKKYWKDKAGVSARDSKIEFDSRFALMPSYPNGRRFKEGVLSQTHHWTVHEVKEMMKVFMGVAIGLMPDEAIPLLVNYLHIHRLSHYDCHTERSLEWLADSVEKFFECLTGPDSIFIKSGVVQKNSHQQKMHYMRHYDESVRSKGALPAYSTDRTEIWHKPLKNAYKRSNKLPSDAYKFILKEYSTLAAFQRMINNFDPDSSTEGGTAGTGEDSEKGQEVGEEAEGAGCVEDMEGEQSGDGVDDSEVVAPGDETAALGQTTFQWPKRFRKGWPMRASAAGELLKHPEFQEAVFKYFRTQYGSAVDEDPNVGVVPSIGMSYPTWVEDEVLSSGSGPEAPNPRPIPPEYVIPSVQKIAKRRINANDFRRHDTVLVKVPPPPSGGTHLYDGKEGGTNSGAIQKLAETWRRTGDAGLCELVRDKTQAQLRALAGGAYI
jgi:hypothetical protein